MTNIQHFKSSYSKIVLATTVIGMILMHGVFMYSMRGMTRSELWSTHFFLFAFLFFLSTSFVLYIFAIQIKKITLTDEHLIIQKRFYKIAIPRNEITKVERKENLKSDIPLFGIAYFFGHYGIFHHSQLGNYRIHVKDNQEMLAIHTPQRIYVVSCDNSEKLLRLLEQAA